MNSKLSTVPLRSLASALVVVALAACSSGPPTAPALAASEASIESARSSGAPELAAAELNNAREKLARARVLAQADRNVEAIRLAEQADVDAQLARALASSERSQRALAEVEASLRTLREELNRRPAAAATPSPVAPVRPPQ